VVAAAQKNLAADPKNPDLLLKLAQAQSAVWQDQKLATNSQMRLRQPDLLPQRL